MTLSSSTLVRACLFTLPLLAFSVNEALASQAAVKWTDTATTESGFKIDRKVSPTGTYAQLALTPANSVAFVDSPLAASTTYCYRVRAYNTGGDSGYSPELCGTMR